MQFHNPLQDKTRLIFFPFLKWRMHSWLIAPRLSCAFPDVIPRTFLAALPAHLPCFHLNFLCVPPATSCVPRVVPDRVPYQYIRWALCSLIHSLSIPAMRSPYILWTLNKLPVPTTSHILSCHGSIWIFRGSSSKSSKYFTKSLAERFTRLLCRCSKHRKIILEGVEAKRFIPTPAHLQANLRASYPCTYEEGSNQKKE